jgi:hypothetical protein
MAAPAIPAVTSNGRLQGGPSLVLPDAEAVGDLETFVGRARRVDPEGAVRLVASGEVLAVYASPVHGADGPVVLGLRVLTLVRPAVLDVTVPLAALLDRFPRRRTTASAPYPLALPPTRANPAWAGVTSPREGWEADALLDATELRAAAERGVREISAGVPPGAGAAAVAHLRARVWGRPVSEQLADVPAGVAFAADALGFLADAEPVALYRRPPWVRATTRRGHVLARRPALALGLGD